MNKISVIAFAVALLVGSPLAIAETAGDEQEREQSWTTRISDAFLPGFQRDSGTEDYASYYGESMGDRDQFHFDYQQTGIYTQEDQKTVTNNIFNLRF